MLRISQGAKLDLEGTEIVQAIHYSSNITSNDTPPLLSRAPFCLALQLNHSVDARLDIRVLILVLTKAYELPIANDIGLRTSTSTLATGSAPIDFRPLVFHMVRINTASVVA